MVTIAASILGADWLNFGDEIRKAEACGADLIQIDIADGHFTPTITFGEELVKRCREVTSLPIEVHLMVSRPTDWFEMMAERGVETVIFHVEAVQRLHSTIDHVRSLGLKAGVALNTETDPALLKYELGYIDQFTLMAILPGFAGQPFIPETLEKAKILKSMLKERNLDPVLQIDGGVSLKTASDIAECGVNSIVTSSFFYNNPHPKEAIINLRSLF